MKHIVHLLLIGLLATAATAKAQIDSVDVTHYQLRLDIDHSSSNTLVGEATLSLRLLRPTSNIGLDLKQATVDSVWVNGSLESGFSHQSPLLTIPTSRMTVGDTTTVTVFYHGGGCVESYGWGGFHMDNTIHYNLGVAFGEYPHNFGRSWFPCRDNFHDKATYRLIITPKPGWKALCSGQLQSATSNADSSTTYDWLLERPTPTYLVSVAVAPFNTIERDYQGIYGTYPATIGYQSQDSARVYQAYDILEDVIPMYERCFGPYRWGRIGYVGTPKGSMEHANNISLVNSCMTSTSEGCQSVICHELSHAWFGNLITCATSLDMWFNEGGASFCEELAMEAAFGKEYSIDYAKDNLETVLRTTHLTDNGYKPVYGQTPDFTYGSTVYDKGATVWHTIRGYLGDSIYYNCMQRLFDRMAFGTISSEQLRDSLTSYSGVDLSDLFEFHVFGPGFQDFRIDSMKATPQGAVISLRQQLVGTEQYANSNRVPVTFMDDQMHSAIRIIHFDGESTRQEVSLGFSPTLAIVDLQSALSKASICDTLMPYKKGAVELATAHFKTNVKKVDSTAATLLCVTHHWTQPDPSSNPGFVRMAKRYWTVDGILPSGSSMTGMFGYGKSGGSSANANLDYGFYSASATLDSIELLYRKDCSQPWSIVNSQRNGNSAEGYFTVSNLKKGEYTLAVVDESLLNIENPEEQESAPIVELRPNPSKGTFTVHLNEPGSYHLVIRDARGRRVLSRRNMTNDTIVASNLPTGIYFVEIKDKNRTIQVEKLVITNF